MHAVVCKGDVLVAVSFRFGDARLALALGTVGLELGLELLDIVWGKVLRHVPTVWDMMHSFSSTKSVSIRPSSGSWALR